VSPFARVAILVLLVLGGLASEAVAQYRPDHGRPRAPAPEGGRRPARPPSPAARDVQGWRWSRPVERPQPPLDRTASLRVAEIALGAGSPGLTMAAALGVHGWLAGRYRWALEAGALKTVTRYDLDDNGAGDYSTADHLPHLAAGVAFGLPIVRRADAGGVTDLAVVSGARLSPSPFIVAVPLGVRLAHRTVEDTTLIERWAEVRALVLAPSGKLGLDAEVGWMPARFGVSLFALLVPQLSTGGEPLRCGVAVCVVDYPMSAFNPEPYASSVQVGLRLRIHHPF
jgi:hypothetical protein